MMRGMMTRRMVSLIDAPRLRAACSSRTSKLASEAETVMIT